MRNTQRSNSCESTTSYIVDWSSVNWFKANKHVDKLQKRIYRAECDGVGDLIAHLGKICLSRMC